MSQIVYIAGYGRSGSSILDAILGNHNKVFGGGELCNIFNEEYHQEGVFCGCGQKIHENCPFWQDVFGDLTAEIPNFSLKKAFEVTRRVESSFLFRKNHFKLSAKEKAQYGNLWDILYKSIVSRSNCDVIIDSSKTAFLSTHRIQAINTLTTQNIKIIHLTRHPSAVIGAFVKGGNLQNTLCPPKRAAALRATIGWSYANWVADYRIKKERVDSIQLHYEDLIQEPIKVFLQLEDFLQLSLSSIIETIKNDHPFEPGHGIAGNRARRRNQIKLKTGSDIKPTLSKPARMILWLTWPLARKYGYVI